MVAALDIFQDHFSNAASMLHLRSIGLSELLGQSMAVFVCSPQAMSGQRYSVVKSNIPS